MINNAETLATIWIVREGAASFSSRGTGKSKDAKTFALARRINRGGLAELPMGMTMDPIINDIGGGVPKGKYSTAVSMGRTLWRVRFLSPFPYSG
ncbi:MAG: hypothetical protein P8L18_14250 [Verrucomicrobiota bacterium]|nr:hypothetical protein [Verrucomicrobiota bacterium]